MEWGLRTMIGLLGYNFCLDGNCLDPMPTSTNEITSTKLQNGIFSHFNTSKDVTGNYSYVVPTEWDFDTIMDANFENNIGAGTLSEITKDITSIRIKRREKGTFDWVTIKEVPISGIDDFSLATRIYQPGDEVQLTLLEITTDKDDKKIYIKKDFEVCHNSAWLVPQYYDHPQRRKNVPHRYDIYFAHLFWRRLLYW